MRKLYLNYIFKLLDLFCEAVLFVDLNSIILGKFIEVIQNTFLKPVLRFYTLKYASARFIRFGKNMGLNRF
jgi:hypothetical protein